MPVGIAGEDLQARIRFLLRSMTNAVVAAATPAMPIRAIGNAGPKKLSIPPKIETLPFPGPSKTRIVSTPLKILPSVREPETLTVTFRPSFVTFPRDLTNNALSNFTIISWTLPLSKSPMEDELMGMTLSNLMEDTSMLDTFSGAGRSM